MNWKLFLLTALALATVTACAHPLDREVTARADARRVQLSQTARISAGACDDVGQYIPAAGAAHVSLSQEASAAPTHR